MRELPGNAGRTSNACYRLLAGLSKNGEGGEGPKTRTARAICSMVGIGGEGKKKADSKRRFRLTMQGLSHLLKRVTEKLQVSSIFNV
jgi:hypothetical protein